MSDSNREKLKNVLKYLDVNYVEKTRNSLNISCPFCPHDEKNHLGIFLDNFRFSCWKCKTSGTLYDLLHELCNISWGEFKSLLMTDRPSDDDGKTALQLIDEIIKMSNQITAATPVNKVEYPPKGSIPIDKWSEDLTVQAFIQERNLSQIDPRLTGLGFALSQNVYIGVAGRYTGRFIIPIYFEGAIAAYQARDMTGRAEARYFTEGEVSLLLYNYDGVDLTKPVAITEGIIDSWFTPNSVSTFSSAFSPEQKALMLAMDPPYWILCWDMGVDGSDAYWKGRREAQDLAGTLGPGKIRYVNLPPGQDPAKLGRVNMERIITESVEL